MSPYIRALDAVVEGVNKAAKSMSEKLAEEQDGISPQVVGKKERGRPQGGVEAAARELNINREDARRAVKVASLRGLYSARAQ